MITLPNRLLAPLSKLDPLLPLLARLTFAATLAGYFWASALTKLGPSPWQPSTGAYAQILPRLFERVGYDASQLSLPQHLLVISGTWAEFLLPALLLIGLHTRAAALGMIGFIFVQTLTDLFGHGALFPTRNPRRMVRPCARQPDPRSTRLLVTFAEYFGDQSGWCGVGGCVAYASSSIARICGTKAARMAPAPINTKGAMVKAVYPYPSNSKKNAATISAAPK